MSSIDNLKTLLEGRVSGLGNRKLQVFVNEENVRTANCVRLFYTNDNDRVEINSRVPYYFTGVQVTVRHELYDTARNSCFSALEYINSNRKTRSGVYWIPDSPPTYLGVDSETGGFVWGFDMSMKGAK
jgi:hypothetical protein